MTAADPIARARELLDDLTEPYRWSDAKLLVWLSDAQEAIAASRPDELLSASNTITAIVNLTATGDTTIFGAKWRLAMARFVTGQALMERDEEGNVSRGAAFLSLFERSL